MGFFRKLKLINVFGCAMVNNQWLAILINNFAAAKPLFKLFGVRGTQAVADVGIGGVVGSHIAGG